MMIGIVISDLANPFFSQLANQVESLAKTHGYLTIIASSDDDGRTNDLLIERLMEQRVDGLLIVPPRVPQRDWAANASTLPPVVSLDRPLGDCFDAVLADDCGGAYTATQTLLKNRPQRIAFLGDALSLHTMGERHRGFAQAIADDGRTEMLVNSSAHTMDDAYENTLDLLEDKRLDAIFTANNRSSLGALKAFGETGRRLPQVGFDDFEAAAMMRPAVSVMGHDFRKLALASLDLLRKRIQGWDEPPQTVTVPAKLILRGSEMPDK
jgi:LacI family transcriptional regulator